MSSMLLTDSKILENVGGTSNDEKNDVKEDSFDIERVVKSKEAKKDIETSRIFLESQGKYWSGLLLHYVKTAKNCQV